MLDWKRPTFTGATTEGQSRTAVSWPRGTKPDFRNEIREAILRSCPQFMIGPPISDTRMRVSFRQNLLPEEGRFAVKRKRFSVEQIVAVLKQAEVGVPVAELIRQVGISEQTLYRGRNSTRGW